MYHEAFLDNFGRSSLRRTEQLLIFLNVSPAIVKYTACPCVLNTELFLFFSTLLYAANFQDQHWVQIPEPNMCTWAVGSHSQFFCFFLCSIDIMTLPTWWGCQEDQVQGESVWHIEQCMEWAAHVTTMTGGQSWSYSLNQLTAGLHLGMHVRATLPDWWVYLYVYLERGTGDKRQSTPLLIRSPVAHNWWNRGGSPQVSHVSDKNSITGNITIASQAPCCGTWTS